MYLQHNPSLLNTLAVLYSARIAVIVSLTDVPHAPFIPESRNDW
jgi:hypothetical protein